MGDPMRIRAVATGNLVEVKILMRHIMESGQRKDAAGKIIPAHFIKSVMAKSNDKVVLDASFGTAVSKDPFLSFKYKGGAKGDKVTVSWIDNKGDTRSDEVVVS
ncbi:MAG: thiosulfate oxidation carrier complex protein SoxZ [Burkholderiaceae bacterium]